MITITKTKSLPFNSKTNSSNKKYNSYSKKKIQNNSCKKGQKIAYNKYKNRIKQWEI